MNKQVQDATTDVLRTAYTQAKGLADTIDKTLRKTLEQLSDETDDLTEKQAILMHKAFYWIITSRRELKEAFNALWRWQYCIDNPQERQERQDKQYQ